MTTVALNALRFRAARDDARTAGTGPAAISLRAPAIIGVVATASVVAGAVAGGTAFVSHLPGAWFFGTPGGPLGSLSTNGAEPPALALLGVYGGLALLVGNWLNLLRLASRHRGIPVARVLAVIALWAVPVLLAPPLFSRDVYSYAAQGEMVSHHINPYLYGTGVIGATPFTTFAGPLWGNTPSPYGPVFLAIAGFFTTVAGHGVLADVVLLRLLALAGLALAAASVPTLARAAGRDPAEALVLSVGSPLALVVLLGGAHNDALMAGLLLAGLAVAIRVGEVPAIVLCALAAGVKAPALLGVVFIGWNWPGAQARVRARLGHCAGALLVAAGTLGAVSAVTGIGWRWVRTATAPSMVTTAVSPVDTVSHGVAALGHLIGLDASVSAVHSVASVVGLAVALVVGVWLLARSPTLGTERALGLALLVVAVLGPVLWAWYVAWGMFALAPVVGGRLRPWVIALSVAETILGATSLRRVALDVAHTGVGVDVLVALGIVAMALIPLVSARGERGGSASPRPASVPALPRV